MSVFSTFLPSLYYPEYKLISSFPITAVTSVCVRHWYKNFSPLWPACGLTECFKQQGEKESGYEMLVVDYQTVASRVPVSLPREQVSITGSFHLLGEILLPSWETSSASWLSSVNKENCKNSVHRTPPSTLPFMTCCVWVIRSSSNLHA